MRATLVTLATVLVLAVLVLAVPAQAETYVIEANGNLPSDLEDLVTAAGGSLLRVHPEIDLAVADSDDESFGANLEASSNKIKSCTQDVQVQWTPDADADAVAAPQSHNPVDPTTAFFYPCQWNLHQIDAAGAWAQDAFGAPNVKVAVLDTGVDPNHVDLVGKVDLVQSTSVLTPGSSLCNSVLGLPDEETFRDFRFHGTFVATQITSNSLGMAAVAPLAEVVAVKVLNCLGSGSFADVIAGILYAASLDDVHVINMSLGAYFDRAGGAGPLISSLAKAVNFAGSRGKLVVSASGNDFADLQHDGSLISVPAESGSGIAIYSTDVNDDRALYANHGANATWVGAPGGDSVDPAPPLPGCPVDPASQGGSIGACSTDSIFFGCGGNGLYLINGSGTSFASPIAAGVAALVDGEAGGALSAAQLKTILKNTADDLGPIGTDNEFSHGRVNASRAVQ
jgi:subtilisin family serine protease